MRKLLTPTQELEIIRRYMSGSWKQSVLAREFQVDPSTISRLLGAHGTRSLAVAKIHMRQRTPTSATRDRRRLWQQRRNIAALIFNPYGEMPGDMLADDLLGPREDE